MQLAAPAQTSDSRKDRSERCAFFFRSSIDKKRPRALQARVCRERKTRATSSKTRTMTETLTRVHSRRSETSHSPRNRCWYSRLRSPPGSQISMRFSCFHGNRTPHSMQRFQSVFSDDENCAEIGNRVSYLWTSIFIVGQR